MSGALRWIIYSDLDGTFLDAHTYSYQASLAALREALGRGMAVVFCSSKTGAEIARLKNQLGFAHPFVAENGGGIFVPEHFFGDALQDLPREGTWRLMALGAGYARLVGALQKVRRELGISARGFADMSVEEVASRCSLGLEEACLAKQRRFDEPFLLESEDPELLRNLRAAFGRLGLQFTRGGRFYHLTGAHDKGRALLRLNELFLRRHSAIRTVGLGDSINDLPLLACVDRAYLVQRPDGTHEESVGAKLPEIVRVPAVGPHGWARAVMAVIEERAR